MRAHRFKTGFLLIVMSLFLFLPIVSAQVSPTAEPTKVASPSSAIDKEVQNLKDKVASKVDELRKKNLKAVAGTVTEVGKTTLKIRTNDGDVYTVQVDKDLTKTYIISGTSKKEQDVKVIEKDAYIIVSGPLVDKEISANVIYQDEQYLVETGKITEVNTDDSFIKVVTTNKANVTLDIETTTRFQLLDSKTHEPGIGRFSNTKEGDTVHFVVRKTGKETQVNRYSAMRILIVPQEFFIK